MLTIFALPRSFTGLFDIIQRNAIKSWTLLRPKCEVILFGNEEGVAEAAKDLGVLHVPEIKTNKYGTPLVNDFLNKARDRSIFEILVKLNPDIILMNDFIEAIQFIQKVREQPFLMVGQRWDLDVREKTNFNEDNWDVKLRERLKKEGKRHGLAGMDYSIFPKSFNFTMPPFSVGRCVDDGWMVYQARSRKIPVIDATNTVTIIHQNHYYPQKRKSFYKKEVEENIKLAGGLLRIMTLRDADWVLTPSGLKKPPFIRMIFSKLSLFYPWRLLLAVKRKLK